MKAKIKSTGEIINIAEYDIVVLDKCDSYGVPIKVPYENIELLQEKSDNIDWEQRRYEITKEVLAGFCKNSNQVCVDAELKELAIWAIECADNLIAELKKGGEK